MRTEKVQLVKNIGNRINDSKFIYFISYKGLTVKQFSELRGGLAACGASCQVLKNRLIMKAAEMHADPKIAELKLSGDTAMVSGAGDPGVVAKVLADFAKSHAQVVGKSGYLDGELLSDTDVKAIADLPSREVLLSMLVGTIQAPARDLVSVLNNAASGIVNVINARKNDLENQ